MSRHSIIVLSCSECVLKCKYEKFVLGINMGWRKSQWFCKNLPPSEFEKSARDLQWEVCF